MMDKRAKFWIFQGGCNQDYELLVYEDHRIVVPRSGRHALLQAAHAAAHQRLGSTRKLLERSFYWPNMQYDAYHYEQACREAHKAGGANLDQQHLAVTPDVPPEQTATEHGTDQASVDLSIWNEEDPTRPAHDSVVETCRAEEETPGTTVPAHTEERPPIEDGLCPGTPGIDQQSRNKPVPRLTTQPPTQQPGQLPYRTRNGRCMSCLGQVPAGERHPIPCPAGPVCYNLIRNLILPPSKIRILPH